MPRINIHPGRELLQCARHRNAWYPRAAGCALCKAERRELSEASRDLAQAIRHADSINAAVEQMLMSGRDLTRAFAVSDIEAQR